MEIAGIDAEQIVTSLMQLEVCAPMPQAGWVLQ